MNFEKIDIEAWPRKEYFAHYHGAVPCTYSITVNLPAARLLSETKRRGFKFYPAMLYVLTQAVNNHAEFRIARDADGCLGTWQALWPAYTVFDEKSESFSSLCTPCGADFAAFHADYLKHVAQYGAKGVLCPQPDMPRNTFPVSAIPWAQFTGFTLHLPKSDDYFAPIFTIGKYFSQGGETLLPLSVQVHHAVADGFHTARLLNDCANLMQNCAAWLPQPL